VVCDKAPGSQSLGFSTSDALRTRSSTHWTVVDRRRPRSRLPARQRSSPRRFERCTWVLSCRPSLLTCHFSQSNILIDGTGSPRLSDFGLSSITENIDSVNASTPNYGGTVRYCAPEILGVDGVVRPEKKRPTNKSDVYSLSMVIVEVRLFSESIVHPGSDPPHAQLVTGRKPFPDVKDYDIITLISKSKRPPKPHSFDAPGMTPAVWKIAQKCWHQKGKERPKANAVLQSLERLANPGVCSRSVFLSGVEDN